MDLTERVKAFRSRQRQAPSWVLTAGRSPPVVVAMGDRLTLLLIGQVLARPDHLLAAVTSEQDALSWIANEQPTLLICTAPLEEGSCLSLCRTAHRLCPETDSHATHHTAGHRCGTVSRVAGARPFGGCSGLDRRPGQQ